MSGPNRIPKLILIVQNLACIRNCHLHHCGRPKTAIEFENFESYLQKKLYIYYYKLWIYISLLTCMWSDFSISQINEEFPLKSIFNSSFILNSTVVKLNNLSILKTLLGWFGQGVNISSLRGTNRDFVASAGSRIVSRPISSSRNLTRSSMV